MGSREGFDAAFRTLFVQAFGVALRILGDRAEAEDVAAETMARTLVAWRRIGECGYVDAWVARVAANVAVEAARRRTRLNRVAAQLSMTARDAAVHRGDAEDAVRRMIVAEAVAGLPRRQREVVTLRYFTDLSESDIARVLSISPGTVKRYAHRALARLRSAEELGPAAQITPTVVGLAID
jgi:RNA polymerase sigma factor (sigma-70 family)